MSKYRELMEDYLLLKKQYDRMERNFQIMASVKCEKVIEAMLVRK
jgi:hypothetical protein